MANVDVVLLTDYDEAAGKQGPTRCMVNGKPATSREAAKAVVAAIKNPVD